MLTGYMDGELDLVYRMEVERHLQTCPECKRSLTDGRTLAAALHSKRLYYAAPKGLESRVLTAVRTAADAQRPPTRRGLRPFAVIAASAVALAGLWFVFAQTPRTLRAEAVTQQITCSHLRSLMAMHLLDVASADPTGVKAWFSGKLDYVPPVADLTVQNYPLQGARLDYLSDRPVAALVYKRHNHTINLFVWPASELGSPAIQQESRHGYRLCRWTLGAMTYWAVSDLSAEELNLFAQTVQEHTPFSAVPERCE